MNNKITFEINGWAYNISTKDDFAAYLQSKISKDFNTPTPDSRKVIVNAYIKAQYELFHHEKVHENILSTITELIQ